MRLWLWVLVACVWDGIALGGEALVRPEGAPTDVAAAQVMAERAVRLWCGFANPEIFFLGKNKH